MSRTSKVVWIASVLLLTGLTLGLAADPAAAQPSEVDCDQGGGVTYSFSHPPDGTHSGCLGLGCGGGGSIGNLLYFYACPV